MMVEIESRLGCRWATALLWVLGGCSTDVDIYRLRVGRAASGAAATTSSNSPNILIPPASAAPIADDGCQPGHYVGTFNGTYNSAAVANGSLPLVIAATPSLGRPGLEFWLERTTNDCGDEEFCADFTLKGGKIRGFADPFSDGNTSSDGAPVAVHFEIDFAGDLDCSLGLFRGLLRNGCYDVLGVLYRFEGNAPADYDPASSTFINGEWMVKEIPSADAWFPPDANIGGMGNWQAGLENDGLMPAAEGGGLCDK